VKWIVGLGNPGRQYESTRHNIGFMVIDRLAQRWNITIGQEKHRSLIGEGWTPGGEKVALIKPMTYMNLSGEAVRSFMDYRKAALEDLLVIYDDLDTPFGKLRLRYQGSSGGHNGIRSIIQHAGTERFNRIRVGISRPPAGVDVAHYVLSPFSKDERMSLDELLDKACDAAEAAVAGPFEKAMAKFNG
jgi:PTH1 family peptidyl-tRNA hydrolase